MLHSKVITEHQKEQIVSLASAKTDANGLSLGEVSAQSQVHKTNLSFMLSEDHKWKDKSLSDHQWEKLAEWAGFNFDEQWVINRKDPNFIRFYNLCTIGKMNGLMYIISARFGRGKTTAMTEFQKDHPKNTFYLECKPSWKEKVFLTKLKKVLGINTITTNVADSEDEVVEFLEKLQYPIVMIDEWNELPFGSKRLIKSFQNALRDRCGWVIAGGEHLKKDMDKGLRLKKQSYQEIHSRGGGEIHESVESAKMQKVLAEIVMLNGVTDPNKISEFVNKSNGDKRKLKRLVLDTKFTQKAKSIKSLPA